MVKLALLSFLIGLAAPQTFSDLGLPPSITLTSDACKQALTTVINCPAVLLQMTRSDVDLDSSTLNKLCSDSCSSSLLTAQNNIRQSCTAYFDFIVDESVIWPATYIADKLKLAADLACLKDSYTNDFCYNTLKGWSQDPSTIPGNAADTTCTSCILGQAQISLNSPLRYNDALASAFNAATSSCSSSQYSYTSPAPYAINTLPAAEVPNNTVTCASTYTVKDGDTCDSITRQFWVSTDSLRRANGLVNSCDGLPAAGGSLCIPASCQIYYPTAADSCQIIIDWWKITSTQFLTWNPNINNMCGNFDAVIGEAVCVSPPGGTPPCALSTATGTATGTAVTTTTAVPTNADSNSNKNCGAWYTVQSGDYCKSISLAQSISLQDLYFLNPDINSDCTNLYLGLAYCIRPVGSISTYSGYPTTSQYITLTSTSYTTAAVAALPTWTLPPIAVEAQLPLAPDTISGCMIYQNFIDPLSLAPAYINIPVSDNATEPWIINDCVSVAAQNHVNTTQLMQWNPSLGTGSTNCTLKRGYSYCVLRNVNDEQPYRSTCSTLNATMSGTSSQCNCYASVWGSDRSNYNCATMATDWNTTVSSILSYNSWLGSDCDGSLYNNLQPDSLRTVCVDIDASLPQSS